jgi:hypothetical protein
MEKAFTSKKSGTPVPKEHGAWFMLGHCLLIGSTVSGSFGAPVLLVIAASVLVFVAMQGLKQLTRAFRRREHQIPMRVPWASVGFLLAAGVAGLAAVVGWDLKVLLVWGVASLVLTAVYAWVLFQRRERSLLGEWLGIFGLTMSAGTVWTAGNGGWGREALWLWALAFLYFGGSVPYVKLRVKQMKTESHLLRAHFRLAGTALLYTFVTLALIVFAGFNGMVPALAVVPFVLSLAKVVWVTLRRQGPMRVAHVGYSEVVFSTVFAVVTIVAFWPY